MDPSPHMLGAYPRSATTEALLPVSSGAGKPPWYMDPIEWRYEMRREYQEILPGVFLGPFTVARNLEAMQQMGISHCVLIRDPQEHRLLRPLFPHKLRYLEIDVRDDDHQNVISLFPQFRAFLLEAQQLRNQHLQEIALASASASSSASSAAQAAAADGLSNVASPPVPAGNVLVYCRDGISRSPTFMIAYVMEMMGLDFPHAYAYVQNRRFCLNPNDGFKLQLQEYEPIFRARQQVDQCFAMQSPHQTKRALEVGPSDGELHQAGYQGHGEGHAPGGDPGVMRTLAGGGDGSRKRSAVSAEE